MNDDDYDRLMLEHANGQPLRDILAESYAAGHEDGYEQALRDER